MTNEPTLMGIQSWQLRSSSTSNNKYDKYVATSIRAIAMVSMLRHVRKFRFIIIIIFWPRYSIPREWKKLCYAIQKSTKIKLE